MAAADQFDSMKCFNRKSKAVATVAAENLDLFVEIEC